MLLPTTFHPLREPLQWHWPHLRPSQARALSLWVGAIILVRSNCQNAVLKVLQSLGLGWHTTRPYLRA